VTVSISRIVSPVAENGTLAEELLDETVELQ
jgi:hypothetical protein